MAKVQTQTKKLVGPKRVTLKPNERDAFAFQALRDKLGITDYQEIIRMAITKLAESNGIELPKVA